MQILSNIKALIQAEGSGPEIETVKEIDRRLRICKNPEKVKGSKAWLKKQQEADEKARLKRLKKAEEAAKKAKDEDPFGGELLNESQGKPIDEDDDD